jgi:hypothetical protein
MGPLGVRLVGLRLNTLLLLVVAVAARGLT